MIHNSVRPSARILKTLEEGSPNDISVQAQFHVEVPKYDPSAKSESCD